MAWSGILSTAKTLWKLGSWAVALVDEFRREQKQKSIELAAKRREMSQRYSEASKTAGPVNDVRPQ